MPKCMLHAIRGYKSGKYFENIEHDPYVMTTRSGLTIRKVPTPRNGQSLARLREVLEGRNNNAKTQRKRTSIVKYKSMSYLSFVTRFHISLRIPDLELAGVNPKETLQYLEDSPFIYRRNRSSSGSSDISEPDSITPDHDPLHNNKTNDDEGIDEIFGGITLSDTEDNFFYATLDEPLSLSTENSTESADEIKDVMIADSSKNLEDALRTETFLDNDNIDPCKDLPSDVEVCDQNNSGTSFPITSAIAGGGLSSIKLCNQQTPARLLKCPECSKTFSLLTSFTVHLRMHARQKNRCYICSKIFTRSWLLKGHMRIHTGERPFCCLYPGCDKAFADKSNLRSHSMIHTVTAKNYNCLKCGRAFAQKRYLHKHMLEVCRMLC
ncbi:hypothetical protein ScPMuIL_001045 [Solemya velum]